jgi:hypothetical protein
MANTYVALAKFAITSNTASVTFSAIPATYTDLVLTCSGRSSTAPGYLLLTMNGSPTSSETDLRQDNTTIDSVRSTGDGQFFGQGYLRLSDSGMTTNTFGSIEIYIPNYAGSQKKCASAFSVTETLSASVQFITLSAANSDLTSAITSITCGSNFATGTHIDLYGIKNT